MQSSPALVSRMHKANATGKAVRNPGRQKKPLTISTKGNCMNRKANDTFEMVTRTGDFAITSVGLFPKTSAATEIAAALKAGVKTLKEEARNIASAEMALRSGG